MTSPVQPDHVDEPGLVEPEGVQSSAEPPVESTDPTDGPPEAEEAQSDEMVDRPADVAAPGQELAAGEG